MLYDVEPKTLWERDTRTLPRRLQVARRRYRRFAAEVHVVHAEILKALGRKNGAARAMRSIGQ